ncbi:MAG TPA: hypothetical protein PLV92_23200 [Pirellulaceae bacterium]|nr:hypothetical protein [Pirellulaceae bacterium]
MDAQRAELHSHARALGALLFDVLFTEPSSRAMLDAAKIPGRPRPLVALRCDDDVLLSLPWELLHDGQRTTRASRMSCRSRRCSINCDMAYPTAACRSFSIWPAVMATSWPRRTKARRARAPPGVSHRDEVVWAIAQFAALRELTPGERASSRR